MFLIIALLVFSFNVFANGFVFEPWTVMSDSEVKERLHRIKESGASHVSFLVFICQKGLDSNYPGECHDFAGELQKKVRWAGFAKKEGLTFDIYPLAYSLNDKGDWVWRGLFKPTDVEKWFSNYGLLIQKITTQSSLLGASYQVVGSEMVSLHKYENRWTELAQRLKSKYKLPLMMNINWSEKFPKFWNEFDFIGVSAYFPVAKSANSSVKEMMASWKSIKDRLLRQSRHYQKPLVFTEIGYSSVNASAVIPYDYNYSGRKVDMEEQRRAFEAFRRVWQDEKQLHHAIVWVTTAPGQLENLDQDKTYEPFNKPAIEEIKLFFHHKKPSINM